MKFKICVEGEATDVSQIQVTFSFTVAGEAGGGALTATILPPPSLKVGEVIPDATVVANITGGVPPYTFASDPTSQPMPPGTSLTEDGAGNVLIAGTPSAAGSFPGIVLNVTDADASTTPPPAGGGGNVPAPKAARRIR